MKFTKLYRAYSVEFLQTEAIYRALRTVLSPDTNALI